jgi:hypothetical protein
MKKPPELPELASFEPLRQQLLAAARAFAGDAQGLGALLEALVDDVHRVSAEPLEIFPVCHRLPAAAPAVWPVLRGGEAGGVHAGPVAGGHAGAAHPGGRVGAQRVLARGGEEAGLGAEGRVGAVPARRQGRDGGEELSEPYSVEW